MDGENNGRSYYLMDDLGVSLFLETPIYTLGVSLFLETPIYLVD